MSNDSESRTSRGKGKGGRGDGKDSEAVDKEDDDEKRKGTPRDGDTLTTVIPHDDVQWLWRTEGQTCETSSVPVMAALGLTRST